MYALWDLLYIKLFSWFLFFYITTTHVRRVYIQLLLRYSESPSSTYTYSQGAFNIPPHSVSAHPEYALFPHAQKWQIILALKKDL